ncbi:MULTISPECIES: CpaF family protein [Actinomycetaceae]|uniref:CpaF family protein n=2 Tax=Actinomycetales TaxID=2037 RepID=UPI001E2F275D|nr:MULTISPECIES: ATPase, T2SS/T4P/T4SS family [Actinomycetaceae]MDP9834908.1 pilus assembly protein CpaF [Gleimia europaea]MDU5230829.1 ATPase, T2SS/T4P/T4SS family [Actinomyces sp.]MDU5568368.1 ATPase, T2SS/T4P/T4SS family [Actinomyces sp.]MDU6756262.1 ATPase, T2SS/T4P/T4SS family [Actinomyces sp.]MDU7238898.1 ATPase, T2SS/T4P/T4SS family [Actinomyces sp.]
MSTKTGGGRMTAMSQGARGEWVRRAVADAGFDPVTNSQMLRSIVDRSFDVYTVDDEEERQAVTTALMADIGGYGPLQKYLDDPEVEELYVNSPSKVFVARRGQSELTPVILSSEDVKDLVERMLHHSGRRLDLSAPFVDAMLPGGERLHVVIPPVAGREWSLNIRKHLHLDRSLWDLVEAGSLTQEAARFLSESVQDGATVLVAGATQAGKTTLARALAREIPPRERVITCEEVFELNLPNRDCVAMQTRSANIEGHGEVKLRDLVRESLRMRPDRIVVGEVRGAEALDMLLSLNAGIPGLSTIHANTAREALRKLCLLPLLAGENVTSAFVIPTVGSSIDLVVHVVRDGDGRRHVQEIVRVEGANGSVISAATLFEWNGSDLVSKKLSSATNQFQEAFA